MYEYFTRSQSENLVGWNAAVGATDPKKLGRLDRGESPKIIGIIC
jgi:hypothetical protein